MIGRTVPEWVADHPDQAIPKAVKLRIFAREGGVCHISGRKIKAGEPFDFEHVTPLSMGGRHAEFNLKPALRDKHREKTAAEAGPRAKADRIRAKHLGQWPKSKTPLRSRGFEKSRPFSKTPAPDDAQRSERAHTSKDTSI